MMSSVIAEKEQIDFYKYQRNQRMNKVEQNRQKYGSRTLSRALQSMTV